jgi:vacuolar protein sorting-associated protein VTA1
VTVSEVAEESDETGSSFHPQVLGRERSPEHNKRVQFSSSAEVLHLSSSPPKVPSPSIAYQGPSSIYAPQESKSPSPTFSVNSASSRNHADISISSPPRFPVSPKIHASASSISNIYSSRSYPASVPPTLPPPVDNSTMELTPSMIAKVQRHCRFAISSLDYEDAEQAKKELRTALSLLGGL